jgi:nucleoside phosphorylase
MPAGDPAGTVRSLTSGRASRIFTHFFDVHFLEEKGVESFLEAATREARLAFRLALLMADEVLVPASSTIESELCRTVLSEYGGDEYAPHITLVASGTNYQEFLDDKLRQYRVDDPQGQAYRRARRSPRFPWVGRQRSATGDIAAGWRAQLAEDGFDAILRRVDDERSADIGRRLEELPERLEGRAFIADNVLPIIFDKGGAVSLVARNQFVTLINRHYFSSYAADPAAAIITNMRWLRSDDVRSQLPEHDIDYKRMLEALRTAGALELVVNTPAEALLAVRDDPRFVRAVAEAHGRRTDAEVAKGFYLSADIGKDHKLPTTTRPAVLVLTALPEELSAMLAVCDELQPLEAPKEDGSIYRLGILRDPLGQERQVVIASLSRMGKAVAAGSTTNAIRSFPALDMVIMCGIAGGCPNPTDPETHVRLGDIVVSSQILEYDHVKLLEGGNEEHRSHPQLAGHRLLQAVHQLAAAANTGQRPWEGHAATAEERLAEAEASFARPAAETDVLHEGMQVVAHPERRRPDHPRVIEGLIATGDVLLKNPARRDGLRDRFKVRAIEMEGSAVQSAGWALGKEAVVVRGVSDYGDGHKNDLWRYHAAVNAAAFTRAVVEAMPANWFHS